MSISLKNLSIISSTIGRTRVSMDKRLIIYLEPLETNCDYFIDGRSFHRFILPRLSDSGASNYYAFNWTPNSTNYVVLYSRRISLYQKYPKIHVPTGIVCGHLAFRILFCIWNQYHPVQDRHIQSDKRDVSAFYRSSGHVAWRFEIWEAEPQNENRYYFFADLERFSCRLELYSSPCNISD